MLRTLVYVLTGLGWLIFLCGILLAGASFINNTWVAQLNLPMMYNSPVVTGFGVLLVTSVMTICFLAGAEMVVLCLEIYNDTKKIREFFHKK